LSRAILCLGIVLLAIPLVTAKSSKMIMSWKNPNYSARKFHHVLALGLSDKTGVRANFEDALAAQLAAAGVEAIPGNNILLRPEGTQFDLNYLKTQIRENQIDAVVVSRLIKVENTVTYIPGSAYVAPFPYYNSFYGYYGAVYPVVYSPDYLRKEKRVRIETNLYLISSEEGELAWTGVTDTFNPSNVQKSINGLVKLVVKQMQSDEALPPPQ
jgi:hypothetical protein